MQDNKPLVIIVTILLGILFGAGLLISDMANPSTVQGFLDVHGDWDAALMFVMLGALFIASIGFFLSKYQSRSFMGEAFSPVRRGIDKSLVIGSIIFGLGWGIAGICPAPAIVLMGMGVWQAVVFFIAMLLGMSLVMRLENSNKLS